MTRPYKNPTLWAFIIVLAAVLCIATGGALAQEDQAQVVSPPAALTAASGGTCSTLAATQQTAYESVLVATQDSYVSSSAPDTNYGAETTLRIGSGPAGTYRTLISFDLPADVIILTATLELYQTSSTAAFSVLAQPVTASWTEMAVNWNNQPGTSAVDQATGTLGPDGWVRWDVTPIAQKWQRGSLPNYGLRLGYGVGLPGWKNYNSGEAATLTPRLVVTYLRKATLNPLADTYISQLYPNSNHGNASTLYVQRNATGQEDHTLVSFDVSGVPSGSTVVSASLGLHPYYAMAMQAPQAPQALDMVPEAILNAWDESTVTWNSNIGSASQGDPATAWNNTTWNWFDVTNIAQGWASGTLVNYGIKIKPALGSVDTAEFIASPSGLQAQLIIVYGPEPCYAATSVTIGGATQGLIDTAYDFSAAISPANATAPITYTWQATDQAPTSGSSPSASYTWATPGSKTITVTVENCGSSVQDTRVVSISEPPPACPAPLTGLTLDGPTTAVTGTQTTFTATPSPAGATLPITYTWQATSQSDYTGSQATRNYTWATPGAKTVTVTARNCGGEIVQQATIDVLPRADLVLSGAWYDRVGETVTYILRNAGGSEAPAGHTVTLYRDGTQVAQATFDTLLALGATRAGTIPASWACAATSATMQVCADTGNLITEGSEANNCYEETWSCDLHPPKFTSGPTVTSRTEHEAVIAWTTDELCRSRLDYGKSGPFGMTSIPDNTYRTNHQVTLTGLDSATTYWYKVTVDDAAGNRNNSADAYFETQPPGTDPVTLGAYGLMDYPSSVYEFYTLYVDIGSDPAGVDRISFFLDGQLVGRDVSPDGSRYEVYYSPAAAGLSRTDWFKSHTLQVQAYNLEGEPTAVSKSVTPAVHSVSGNATFVSPSAGYELYINGTTAPTGTTLDVTVYGVEYTWKCTESGYAETGQVPPGLAGVDCGDVRDDVQTMKLLLDGAEVATYLPPDGTFHHTFNVNLAGKGVGTHTLRFRATTSSGIAHTVEREIVLIQGEADFSFERSVTRSGNVFVSTLTIRNTGTGTAYLDFVDDYARGFQVVETETPKAVVTNSDWGIVPDRAFRIDLRSTSSHELELAAGAELNLQTILVPILYLQGSSLSNETYLIGSGDEPTENAVVTYR
ncbi:MAG: DNRLRE domain-containing protein, partial [Anaerolineae bacterium]|nr:DNRLRE domain-containing protein [Anaerolineae bacterium]